MASIRQPSFAAGELAPALRGRHDLAKYAIGLAKCRNFFIARQGSAVSRPGTEFVNEVKDSTKPVRLVPFVFSDSQAFALEFGDGYIRFYQDGGVVLSGGVPYEVTTTYAYADLPRLKFAQAGDIITITHQSYPPAELKRLGNTNWTLSTISYARPTHALGGTLFTVSYSYPPVRGDDAYSASTTYAMGSLAYFGGAFYMSTKDANTGNPISDASWWQLVAEIDRNSGFSGMWGWAVTALVQDTDGRIWETAPYENGDFGDFVISPSLPATLTIALGVGASTYPVWGFRIYRGPTTEVVSPPGRAGTYGLIGALQGPGVFNDVGDEPDYSQAPPQGANPFVLTTPRTGTKVFGPRYSPPSTTTDFPACVAIHEARRWFARTPSRPAFIFGSRTNNYLDYDDQLIPNASSPVIFELAARELFEARSLVSFQKLLVFGGEAVWVVSGAGGPIAFDSIDAKPQTELGASWLTPLVVDDAILYARSKGTGIRELVYDFARQKFSVQDASLLSEHFFVGHQVVDWAYAEDPWSVVWAVRDDGTLLSLTYVPAQEVVAWAQHDTDGVYESVCSVPNGTVDDVYFVVKRIINGTHKRYIERHTNRVVTDDTDPKTVVCLDCATTYDGTPATTISGLDYLEGMDVWALADGFAVGPLTVKSGSITLENAASLVHVGLLYTCQLEQLPLAVPGQEVRPKVKVVRRASMEVLSSRGFKTGPDFDHLVEWKQREVSAEWGELGLSTGLVVVPIPSNWNRDAVMCVQQDAPLPATVLSMTREVESGED